MKYQKYISMLEKLINDIESSFVYHKDHTTYIYNGSQFKYYSDFHEPISAIDHIIDCLKTNKVNKLYNYVEIFHNDNLDIFPFRKAFCDQLIPMLRQIKLDKVR